jgi:hypothetical protein
VQLALDTSILVQTFRRNWQTLSARVPFSARDIAELERDTLALNFAIGVKQQVRRTPRAAVAMRLRLFTLFRSVVADIRRIANYFCGEEETNCLVPAFTNFAKRRRPRTKGPHSS